ncbi:hypothetical protein K2W90_00030 [Candidatus Babeliales bacterium]|nr:hypothetical protein [Candidatus Babeliales bacterium]
MLEAKQFIVGIILVVVGLFIVLPFLTAGAIRIMIIVFGIYLLLSGLRLIRESSSTTAKKRSNVYDVHEEKKQP